ncbi:MAG: DUF4111 domain-containing protein, partial [Lachnospiraceae bacterium]|nr:DUF4111 domain-containing protein [Lachnospiraceae bacterium]
NLCRVLAYKKDGLILSKQEGGNWGINNIAEKYHNLLFPALEQYVSDKSIKWDESLMLDYAAYMIDRIKNYLDFNYIKL